MKYFDAFSGYGGFSLGIQKAYGDNLSGSADDIYKTYSNYVRCVRDIE